MDHDGELPAGSDRAVSDDRVDLSGQNVEHECQGSVGRMVQWTRANEMGKALRQQCLSASTELSENDGNLQIESENVKLGDASFIKFMILSGWTDFVTLNRVSVEGSTSRR